MIYTKNRPFKGDFLSVLSGRRLGAGQPFIVPSMRFSGLGELIFVTFAVAALAVGTFGLRLFVFVRLDFAGLYAFRLKLVVIIAVGLLASAAADGNRTDSKNS